ncbi:hypothetical protein FAZ19_11280 [Sphingobacterium alkalisoli]|uniref:Outer membrane protein beta-barrel domain-containing protein n=1 Tax=Sphingobacterium alkalisoli TaxID=1874115 RepID=A0A4U0H2J2_9SPHI|nr:hypothetical protein [Sphingobacterium alkalisoli]TJY65698.1 hypothetical protein FAZ19_11280 [Sphingobacterium alkalisoli]GGH18860.1 hypothetical protein GCM10011418_22830 [Sphingobacterium alkalisoli]
MKILFFILGLSITSINLSAQVRDSTFQYVEIEAGATIPVGNLKNTMNIAPNIGLWLRQPYAEKSIWACGFSFNFPKKTTFQYIKDEYETETKSFSGVIGFRLDKKYTLNKAKNIDLIWSSVLGYGMYLFDDVRARAEYETWSKSKKDKEDKPVFIKPFSTIHVAQGLQLQIQDFGLQARYNYAPYEAFSDIIDNRFGAHSVTVGLFYRQ